MAPTQISEELEASLFAMQLAGTSSILPMVLKTALELDLLEIIAMAGPNAFLSPSDIAAQLPTNNPNASMMLDRMLRLLASYNVLTYLLRDKVTSDGKVLVERLYGLAPLSKFLTKNEDGASIAPLCLMVQDKDAILDGGIAFDKAHGMPAFKYNQIDKRFNKIFNKGMFDHSSITMKKILETYKGFEGLNSMVDVGGGSGAVLSMIVTKYPSIKGINFDLHHVIEDAPPFPGVAHVGGDMFVSVPKGDAIFIKWICHDWSDEDCLKLLKNCYDAVPRHGKVIVAEFILSVAPDSSLAAKCTAHSDMIMLVDHGGKERTEKEFEELAKAAGFKGFKVVCNAFNTYIMEFLKTN
ncbi:hypothetical protein F8388_025750 [Cannabis sativa]|uniref:caffeate O-methyltransferase n=1 Tax=Cannabis sativa TaxID=3483 RepID=A0A7J6F9H1_CANSA|nr:hypothetical protein F8388_025750 [Cannabis sativa]